MISSATVTTTEEYVIRVTHGSVASTLLCWSFKCKHLSNLYLSNLIIDFRSVQKAEIQIDFLWFYCQVFWLIEHDVLWKAGTAFVFEYHSMLHVCPSICLAQLLWSCIKSWKTMMLFFCNICRNSVTLPSVGFSL